MGKLNVFFRRSKVYYYHYMTITTISQVMDSLDIKYKTRPDQYVRCNRRPDCLVSWSVQSTLTDFDQSHLPQFENQADWRLAEGYIS